MSDYTTTPNLGLYLPTFDADVDNWGLHLNSNFSVLDNALPTGGGTMTGPLHMGTYTIDGSAAAFTGGTLNGVAIGGTTAAAGAFTTLSASGVLTVGSGAATVNSGTGAPTATRPVGSLYLRTDGASGSRLYVSAGGGTWNAVAGV